MLSQVICTSLTCIPDAKQTQSTASGKAWLSCSQSHWNSSAVRFSFTTFFSSPLLQVRLFERKIYLCGTVRADRKHMPKTLKPDKEMKRGDMDTMTANGVTCVKWMDNRSVLLLSNFMPCSNDDVTHVLRRQAGSSEKLRIPCPSIVTTYNKFMGAWMLWIRRKCHMRRTESPKQSIT